MDPPEESHRASGVSAAVPGTLKAAKAVMELKCLGQVMFFFLLGGRRFGVGWVAGFEKKLINYGRW